MSKADRPLVTITLVTGQTQSVAIPNDQMVASIHMSWASAVTSATAILHSSNYPTPTVPIVTASPDLEQWVNESASVPLTGPSAAAAGSSIAHFGNNGARHLMIHFDTVTAGGVVKIYSHGRGIGRR